MTENNKRDWNSTAAGWKKWHPISERAARTATETMLQMAGVSEGYRVVDFATGLGDTAAACAKKVGPSGYVLATDAASAMLEFATEYIASQNLTNVDFQVANFDELKLEMKNFDAGLCRWGLMFAQDLVASLAAIRGLLRPGGSLGAIVWGPPERAEVLSLSNRVLMQSLGLPTVDTGKGTPFGLCDREALERSFGAAGFTNIESQVVSVVYDFSSAEEYVQYRRERSSLEKQIAHCPEEARERAWANVVLEARRRARPDRSIRFVNETIVIAGQNAVQQYF
ncbi:MAG: class I SAM-dependent methyltransferase [Pseudomonadota bacterium]|nr:class I SAM-dependent methyltransferase [Pseudomonadota bacterium]